MKRLIATLVGFSLAASCVGRSAENIKTQGQDAIALCTSQVRQSTSMSFPGQIDHAYVYILPKGYWVIFEHGPLGTFGKRDVDSRTVFSCGLTKRPALKVVFLGAPLEKPVLRTVAPGYFSTLQGATELMFKRANGKFQYCCSQKADVQNFLRHNPRFKPGVG